MLGIDPIGAWVVEHSIQNRSQLVFRLDQLHVAGRGGATCVQELVIVYVLAETPTSGHHDRLYPGLAAVDDRRRTAVADDGDRAGNEVLELFAREVGLPRRDLRATARSRLDETLDSRSCRPSPSVDPLHEAIKAVVIGSDRREDDAPVAAGFAVSRAGQ